MKKVFLDSKSFLSCFLLFIIKKDISFNQFCSSFDFSNVEDFSDFFTSFSLVPFSDLTKFVLGPLYFYIKEYNFNDDFGLSTVSRFLFHKVSRQNKDNPFLHMLISLENDDESFPQRSKFISLLKNLIKIPDQISFEFGTLMTFKEAEQFHEICKKYSSTFSHLYRSFTFIRSDYQYPHFQNKRNFHTQHSQTNIRARRRTKSDHSNIISKSASSDTSFVEPKIQDGASNLNFDSSSVEAGQDEENHSIDSIAKEATKKLKNNKQVKLKRNQKEDDSSTNPPTSSLPDSGVRPSIHKFNSDEVRIIDSQDILQKKRFVASS